LCKRLLHQSNLKESLPWWRDREVGVEGLA
jgi:hypothetical protein